MVLRAEQGLKWCLPRYPRPYWQQRSVSPKWQHNGKYGNFERFVQRQYALAEKCFSGNVMYIPPMSDSSLLLLLRNNYFKISSNTLSNLVCNI